MSINILKSPETNRLQNGLTQICRNSKTNLKTNFANHWRTGFASANAGGVPLKDHHHSPLFRKKKRSMVHKCS